MKKTDRRVTYILAGGIAVLLVAVVMMTNSYMKLSEREVKKSAELAEKQKQLAQYETIISEHDSVVADKQSQIDSYAEQLSAKLTEIEALTAQVETLRTDTERLNETIKAISDAKEGESALVSEYKNRIQQIQWTLSEKEKALADAERMVESFKKLVSSNHGFHSEKIEELYRILISEMPMRTVVKDEETITKRAKVAFYYRDLTTGYTIAHNEKEVLYSASLIKAPYIYCILQEIERFEYNKRNFTADGKPLYDENGEPLFEGAHPNLNEDGSIIYLPGEEKFDLTREWVYDSASMFREGSGIIQEEEDGFTLTYRELVEYTLLYSDNVAFSEIRKVFGYDSYYQTAYLFGIQGVSSAFMNLTAEDCGKFMTEIYRYFETGSEYALMMKDCMIRSNYQVMIVNSLYGITVAHKYGWDKEAYHDMAIAFDEHPFILVIMTDLDTGGTEANAYIDKITRLTNEIHKSHHS